MKTTSVGSRKGLVRDLLGKPACPAREQLIYRASAGYFDDFTSPYDLPKHELVAQLEDAGFADLAAQARAGRYDDEPPTRSSRR